MINICTMKRIVRNSVCVTVLCLSLLNVFASGESNAPYRYSRQILAKSIRVFTEKFVSADTRNTAANTSTPKSSSKICACQILHMQSNNYNHPNVVLLAEKTINGDLSSDAAKAKVALETEKKHLKNYFYSKIKVQQMLIDGTDCKSMFRKLKSDNNDLLLYEILDADITK